MSSAERETFSTADEKIESFLECLGISRLSAFVHRLKDENSYSAATPPNA
jgi:hypothetical protein